MPFLYIPIQWHIQQSKQLASSTGARLLAASLRLLALCLVVCGAFAQAPAVAQCNTSWHLGQTKTDPVYFSLNTVGRNGHGIYYSFNPVPDPVRGFGAVYYNYNSSGVVTPYQINSNSPVCVFFSPIFKPLGVNSNGSVNTTNNGWPQALAGTNNPSNACYQFVVNDGTTNESWTQTVWLVSGSWTWNAPDPPPDPTPPVVPPPGAVSSGLGNLTCKVTRLTGGAAIPYVAMYLYGTDSATVTTDSNGSYTFSQIHSGSYTVHVIGSFKNANNVTVNFNQSVPTSLSSGGTNTCSITVDDSGNATKTDSSGDTSNAPPSWLNQVVQYLFVPDQAHIDECKNALSPVTTWGPLGLVADMVSLNTATAQTMSPISLPVPTLDATGHWMANPTNTVALSFTPVTGNSAFAPLRSVMGFSVWLVFVLGAAKLLLPRQVV